MAEPSNWRERAALKVFKTLQEVRYYDLPANVGYSTMFSLVSKGLIEPTDRTIGPFYKRYSWRLVSPPND